MKRQLVAAANAVLKPLGAQITKSEWEWDLAFEDWVRKAEAEGRDPNDIGDKMWEEDPLAVSLESFYYPNLSAGAVILELGPGSGRLTRHLVTGAKHMILADYSPFACRWLPKYLEGKGSVEVLQLDKPAFPSVEAGSIDRVVANCAFDHICFSDMYAYFREFRRVLAPEGAALVNYVNAMSPLAFELFLSDRGKNGEPSGFEYYHPEVVELLARKVGLGIQERQSHGRYDYLKLVAA